jgi:SagB-type dehydrogenase family enzyme
MTVPTPTLRTVLGLRPGVRLRLEDEHLALETEGRTTSLRLPQPIRDHLSTLAEPRGLDQRSVEPSVQRLLARLGHLIHQRWMVDDEVLVEVESTVRSAPRDPEPVGTEDLVRLDRFALLRSRGDDLVLESPRAVHRCVLSSDLARTLAARLGSPTRVGDAEVALGTSLVRDLMGLWLGLGLVERADGTAKFASDTAPVLRQWDFHDLLMHTRSRSGRFDEPLGALSPYRGQIDPLPAIVPPAEPARTVELPRPRSRESRLSLQEALETRRSIRDYDDQPITMAELGEFLHRTFRDRARFDPLEGDTESKVSRPYPSGGGLYEHELYVTVVRCTGVAAGIHHYDPLHHRLELINDNAQDAAEMLAVAAAATGHGATPDVLLTLTARFQRVSWRYRSIAYANILRNTGAIYQTMYLVATDLDLAPCALGNGDADLSARVLGLDHLVESSVGDFLLGRRRPDDTVVGEPIPGWTLLDDQVQGA